MENTLLEQLKPIFPNLTEEVILLSIRHPSNNTQPGSSQAIFLSCIDDLLQLRTFSESSTEPQKKGLSSDEDESLVRALEKVERKEVLSLNDSIKNIGGKNNDVKQTPDSQESDSGLKLSVATASASGSSDPKSSSSSFQSARKSGIDSEESSNDSLPDPCLNLDKDKDTSGKPCVGTGNLHNQAWSSPLQRCKQKWKVSTGSHSAEVLTNDVEVQRTRYHSEPSDPVFSLNRALKKTGTLIKPAVFSPTKSTDGTVASGLKKATVIKPATFSLNKNNSSLLVDTKTVSIIKPATFNVLLGDEKVLKTTRTKPRVADSIIKPGHFLLKPSSAAVGHSSSPGRVTSLRDSNANYKITPVDSVRDKDISVAGTSQLNNPAGLEKWKHVCVEADNGLLDDEQTYRKEILSKSGEVIGKIQDERRKSLVGLSIQKIDNKEVEKVSTSGTSTKSASKSLLKPNAQETCSQPGNIASAGHSLKTGKIDNGKTSGVGNILKTTVRGLEGKPVCMARSKTGVNEVKKRTNVQVNADKEENIRKKISTADKDDDDLPTFNFLKKARRQREDLKTQPVHVEGALVNKKTKPVDLTRNQLEIVDVKRKEDNIPDKTVTVIDITNSSQSSVGSQDNSVINVEALPEFVDITNEPLDVTADVFEVNAANRNEAIPEVIVVQQGPEPILPGNPVGEIRIGIDTEKNRGNGTRAPRPPSPTRAPQPQPAPILVVTEQPTQARNLPPLPTMEKGPEEKLTDMVNEVLLMFPDVDPMYVKNLLLRNIGPEAMNNVCNLLLENTNYPRAQKAPSSTAPSEAPSTKRSNKNFYEDYSEPILSFEYKTNCELLLQSEFKMISVKDIRILASYYNWHYAPMHKALSQIIKKGLESMQGQEKGKQSLSQVAIVCDVTVGSEKKTIKTTCLKCPRFVKCSLSCLPSDLSEEYEFVKERLKEDATDEDMKIAQQINESEYEETGQLIECGCCFCEVAFDSMVQCYEGHLFCSECLKNYANESVFGHGKTSLLCMSDGCDASFPKSQLDKALPVNILNKYNDRVQEESINLAALDDLVRCPNCDFAALLDPSVKVFSCQNTSCMKETCRHCKEDWKEHFGKRCDEIEKKDEVSLRIKFEEKMAMAKIRTCHRCKAQFMKEEGCNKMTCKCGATMCYVCRKPNIDYNHFCQHLREPEKPCKKCEACFLWSKAEEDDERAIAEIRKECEALRMEKGFSLEKFIGAPEEPPSKKLKVK